MLRLSSTADTCVMAIINDFVKVKGALFVVPHTQGPQAWITQCYLQLHQCLPLPRKRLPDGASPD